MNILIIINPVSGTGDSADIYYNNYHKLSERFIIKEFISRYPKHINDYFMNNLEIIKNYKLIIGIGGDGIIFEILNNIKKYNLDIPLAEIPTGSGNGYFKSLTYSMNKEPTIDEAIVIINNNNILMVDLMEISNLSIYCRLAISWGIISNIDIDTEWMRCLGKYRFDMGGVWNVITCPSYNGRLIYVKDNITNIIEGNFCFVWAGNNSYASTDIYSFPGAKLDDGKIYISYLMNDVSAAYLWGNIEKVEKINKERLRVWGKYYSGLKQLENNGFISLPTIPENCRHNAHMFYVKIKNLKERTALLKHLSDNDILSVFHYIPLHSSESGLKFGRFSADDKFTTQESERLIRLPMYFGLDDSEVLKVINSIIYFFK
mgnify:CR=1 FL=1